MGSGIHFYSCLFPNLAAPIPLRSPSLLGRAGVVPAAPDLQRVPVQVLDLQLEEGARFVSARGKQLVKPCKSAANKPHKRSATIKRANEGFRGRVGAKYRRGLAGGEGVWGGLSRGGSGASRACGGPKPGPAAASAPCPRAPPAGAGFFWGGPAAPPQPVAPAPALPSPICTL